MSAQSLPPLERVDQLIGPDPVGCYGGPLDGEVLKLFRRTALIHSYRHQPTGVLWVVIDPSAVAPPPIRGTEESVYYLLGHYAPGRSPSGRLVTKWFTDFPAACRASLTLPEGSGLPPLRPPSIPPLPPPGTPAHLSPPRRGLSPRRPAFTQEELRAADRATGDALASICRRFLRTPAPAVSADEAANLLGLCLRWIGECGYGELLPVERLYLENHCDHRRQDTYSAHIVYRIDDARDQWEAFNDEAPDEF